MTDSGERERATQRRVVRLFCDDLGYENLGDLSEGKFNPDDWMDSKEQRKVDPFIVFGMAAASMAIETGASQGSERPAPRWS